MGDLNKNSLSSDVLDLSYIKSDNPWLMPFGLTDEELAEVIRLMTRVIINSDSIIGFKERLAEALPGRDEQFVSDLVIAILSNRFLELKPYLKGFDEFVSGLGLGGLSAETAEPKEAAVPLEDLPLPDKFKQQLSGYDWPNITGLERRALLEELGVSPEDFKIWYNNNYYGQ